MCRRAVNGDVGVAKELPERTECRAPAAPNVEGKIDYAAGRSAKEQLLSAGPSLKYCGVAFEKSSKTSILAKSVGSLPTD